MSKLTPSWGDRVLLAVIRYSYGYPKLARHTIPPSPVFPGTTEQAAGRIPCTVVYESSSDAQGGDTL
jgi:hypothetical protein